MSNDLLKSAIELHQAQRLAEAEAVYRQVLARDPANGEALHLLGLLSAQTGRGDLAVQLIGRAVEVRPGNAKAHFDLGNALASAGRVDVAIMSYRNAIALRPDYVDAHNNLGHLLLLAGRASEAIEPCSRAAALAPDRPEPHFNLANALLAVERRDDAIGAYRRAISLRPSYAEAWFNLGNVLADVGQADDALDAFSRAAELKPDWADAYFNLGDVLLKQFRDDEAADAFSRAIATNPNHARAHNNLGVTFRRRGMIDEALACFERALAIDPHFAEARYHRALALLAKGDFAEGWREYEWRSRLPMASEPSSFAPQWHGEPLEGKAILLTAEQGLGDTIQFIRYAPLVSARGGKVVVQCQPELHRLVSRAPGVAHLADTGEHHDVACALMTLPMIFATTVETIPASVPYLSPNPADVETWRRRMSEDRATLKVGLVWTGSVSNPYNARRSIPFDLLHPLLQTRGVSFYSLQKGERGDLPPEVPWTDWTGDLHDMADTAALIANLDLVISIDSAVAHLAGALAKPIWTLHPFAIEWRWMLGRSDSPWYPTMRLFRQPAPGDWQSVVREVQSALEQLLEAK